MRSEDDLGALGLEPVLGSLPMDRRERTTPGPVDEKKQPATAEALRHLRTSLQFIDVDHSVQVLVITSSVPAEGKSFVSRNLALTMAAANQKVLLIEGDLRRPTISDDFDVERVPGLSDVLVERAQLEEALRPWRNTSLTILPAGYLPPNPSELLGSDAARAVLTELRTRYDMIVIDTPPLLPVTDGAVMAALADGVILVVREGKTSRHQLEVSGQRLSLVGARFLGTVLNMVSDGPGGSYSTYDQHPGRRRVQLLGRGRGAPGGAATHGEAPRPHRTGDDPTSGSDRAAHGPRCLAAQRGAHPTASGSAEPGPGGRAEPGSGGGAEPDSGDRAEGPRRPRRGTPAAPLRRAARRPPRVRRRDPARAASRRPADQRASAALGDDR